MNINSYKNAMNNIQMPEERINGILSAAHKAPVRRKKAFRPAFPLIAAAVIMLTGFTVYAANSGVLSLIFGGERDYSPFENMTGEMEIHSLDTYIDGLTVTPMGFAADSYTVYSVFRLDFPQPLPESEKYTELQLDGYGHSNTKLMDILKSFSPEGRASGGAMVRYIKEDSDTLYAAYTVSCGYKMSGEITLDFTCLNLAIGDYKGLIMDSLIYDTPLFSSSFTVNIPDVEGVELETAGTALDGYNAKLYPCSIVIDTVNSARVKLFYENNEALLNSALPTYVTMKNGEKIEISGASVCYSYSDKSITVSDQSSIISTIPYGLNGDYLYYRGYLTYPVAAEEIASLTIGGCTVYPKK
ncbi:MAG: hypothetical protein J6K92_02915 [Oscillospiraceae bacterium]|nr:hypothetical protein [Oscillospiraceae bacterium]